MEASDAALQSFPKCCASFSLTLSAFIQPDDFKLKDFLIKHVQHLFFFFCNPYFCSGSGVLIITEHLGLFGVFTDLLVLLFTQASAQVFELCIRVGEDIS